MRTMLLVAMVLSGCSMHSQAPPAVPHADRRIYAGSVARGEGPALFRYTRDVAGRGATQVSVHRSYAAAGGELVVAQAAEHDAEYVLRRYVEDHRQLGVRSEVRVNDEGALAFATYRDGRTRTRREAARGSVVVGPTLFGFVASHWDALAGGASVPVRFVVAERRRSYPFTLHMQTHNESEAVVVMTAKRPWLRMLVPPMVMTFDTRTRTIVRYEGRVPPRWNSRPLDARVEYEMNAPYR